MKPFTLLTLALPSVLGSPAARDGDTSCNPYTDWGHTQGAVSYYCSNLADWPAVDYNCVKYKSADYCSGKIYCSASNPCGGNAICRWGVCVEKVNGKHCQRTCTY